MPSISTTQRYKSKPVLLKSEIANEADKTKQHIQVAEQMNRPDWDALLSGGLSWNRLHTQPAVYENGFGRDQSFDREGWRPDIQWGGYDDPGRQNNFYATASQHQFYDQPRFQGGQVYGLGQSGRPSLQQPAAGYSGPYHSQAYYQAIHSTTPTWAANVEQSNYSQIKQRYAPFPSQYQPHNQIVPFGNITTQPWLTQPWQTVNGVPLPPPPPPPVNFSGRRFDGSAPVFTSSSSRIPDIDTGLDEVFCTDKGIQKVYDEPSYEFQQRKSYDGGVPLPPPGNHSHRAGWQQVVDIRGAVTNTRDGSTTAVTTTKELRSQQPRHHVQPAFEPPRNNWSRSPANKQQKLHVMERPEPSQKYVEQANQEPRELDASRPLLVVLDLNGTLLHRKMIGSTNFIARPRVKEFLHYLFQHHHVLIWSSAMPSNVKRMSNKLLTGDQKELLIACWGRDKLRIPSHAYHENVQVYKQLSWIWKDKQIQSSNPNPTEVWGQENTVLIDDSFVKAASEPNNAILLDDFEGRMDQMESDVLGQVVAYLETLKCQRDVSSYIRREPFEYDASSAAFDWMPVVNGMHGFALI